MLSSRMTSSMESAYFTPLITELSRDDGKTISLSKSYRTNKNYEPSRGLGQTEIMNQTLTIEIQK